MLQQSHFTTVFLCLLALSSIGRADQADERDLYDRSLQELMDVQTTSLASGTIKSVRLASSISTVITAEAIRNMDAKTVFEILETVPGVHVTATQTYTPSVEMRGIRSYFGPEVLYMINGVPTKELVRGGMSATAALRIPPSIIEKIEIIRGPGSALYGADAYSGVINIVTKMGKDLQGSEIAIGGGSFNRTEGHFLHGNYFGNLNLFVGADYFSTSGASPPLEKDAFGDRKDVDLSRREATLNISAEIGKWTWHLIYGQKNNLGAGQGVGNIPSPSAKFGAINSLLDVSFKDTSSDKNLEWTIRLSDSRGQQFAEKNNILFPAGTNLGNGTFTDPVIGNPGFSTNEDRFSTIVSYKAIENHVMRSGVGISSENLYDVRESKNFSSTYAPLSNVVDVSNSDQAFMPQVSRLSYFALLQDEWNISPKIELTTGLRYDYFNDFGKSWNPRAAMVWSATGNIVAKLIYSTAFRAPAFAELYSQNNPATVGNKDLSPETLQDYEFALSYRSNSNFTLSVNFFHYDAKNFIDITNGTYRNSYDFRGDGIEVEGNLQVLDSWQLSGNFSQVYPIYSNTGHDVGDEVRQKLFIRSEIELPANSKFNTQVNYIGPRNRVEGDSRNALAGSTTVDIGLRKKDLYVKQLELIGSVKNLANSSIYEPSKYLSSMGTSDLPMPGVNYRLELIYNY